MTGASVQALKDQFIANGQGHVFHYWDSLSASQQASLLEQLKGIDPKRVNAIFTKAIQENKKLQAGTTKPVMEPLPADCFQSLDLAAPETARLWRTAGMSAVAQGQVCVALLAGGQGTRLGSALPKGCYDIGLPSKKSLFQLQAERILRLQQLASEAHGGKSVVIPWYVMTSGPTRAPTEEFFKSNSFFGLQPTNVIFFEQGVLPAFTPEGKIILEDKDKVSVAPDGNGGVYASLRVSGVLDDMKKRGIKYIHVYGVDNCLVRVADPVFMGYCISKKAKCGAKVVRKVDPDEPVGVVCKVNGKFGVVEYSEISKEDSQKKTDNDRLAFDAANIANHFYALDFLVNVCSREFEDSLDYHLANKKIKHIDTTTNELVSPSKANGIKLELFIFDIFPFLEKDFVVFSVPREDEFSPLKNAPGAGVDCPETSRRDYYLQCVRFAKQAGAQIEVKPGSPGVEKIKEGAPEVPILEVSPLVSYDGEALEALNCKRIVVDGPIYISSKGDLKKFQ